MVEKIFGGRGSFWLSQTIWCQLVTTLIKYSWPFNNTGLNSLVHLNSRFFAVSTYCLLLHDPWVPECADVEAQIQRPFNCKITGGFSTGQRVGDPNPPHPRFKSQLYYSVPGNKLNAIQSEVHRPAASESPGSLLEMQNLGPQHRLTESEICSLTSSPDDSYAC